jgi:hypothetical protein
LRRKQHCRRLDDPFDDDARRLHAATGSLDKTLTIVDRGEHGVKLVAASPVIRTRSRRSCAVTPERGACAKPSEHTEAVSAGFVSRRKSSASTRDSQRL